jgi:hypothetical protein
MILILYCIRRIESFFLGVIGIQPYAIIFESISIPISHATEFESWSWPPEKKLKKWQKEDDIEKRYLFFVHFFNRISENRGAVCSFLDPLHETTLTKK